MRPTLTCSKQGSVSRGITNLRVWRRRSKFAVQSPIYRANNNSHAPGNQCQCYAQCSGRNCWVRPTEELCCPLHTSETESVLQDMYILPGDSAEALICCTRCPHPPPRICHPMRGPVMSHTQQFSASRWKSQMKVYQTYYAVRR